MRKKVFGRQLGRNRSSRKALFRALTRALVLEGSIVTTAAKAKAVRPEVEKLMGLVKEDSLASRRRLLAKLGNDKETVKKFFGDYSDLAKERSSGFVRIVALPLRAGDNAKMARIEWVKDREEKSKGKK